LVLGRVTEQLEELTPEFLFKGPESASGITRALSRVLSGTGQRETAETVGNLSRFRANGLLLGPSARRIKELLDLNRSQSGWFAHCHLSR
jgi:hypothetical protein